LLPADRQMPLSLGEVDVLLARVRWYLNQAHQEVARLLERGSGSAVLQDSGSELSELEQVLAGRLGAVASLREALGRRLMAGGAHPEGGVGGTGRDVDGNPEGLSSSV
jgi:hypothetical protein